MLFLIDENVPESVPTLLRTKGHDTAYARDKLRAGCSDEEVAALGHQLIAVLVTWNQKHFKRLAARRSSGAKKHRNLSLLCFRCPEPRGEERLEKFMDLIEKEHALAAGLADNRIMIDIHANSVRIWR